MKAAPREQDILPWDLAHRLVGLSLNLISGTSREAMWPADDRGPRYFRNATRFIVAERPTSDPDRFAEIA